MKNRCENCFKKSKKVDWVYVGNKKVYLCPSCKRNRLAEMESQVRAGTR